jgi:competence protein ComGF
MKKFFSIVSLCCGLLLHGSIFAEEAQVEPVTTQSPQILELTPPSQEETFMGLAQRFYKQLEDIHYRTKRHAPQFGYNEIETVKGLEHLMRLCQVLFKWTGDSSEGREAFYMMKQPLTYLSQYLPYNPMFQHVVHSWDQAIATYQRMVQVYTGTNVGHSAPIDFNNPDLKNLQYEAQDLKEISEHFAHQIRTSLPMVTQENHSLVAFADRFAILSGKLYNGSLSFVTRRYEMENNLREITRISRQISAIMLYHPDQYFVNAWQSIRIKGNQFRETFEKLMEK